LVICETKDKWVGGLVKLEVSCGTCVVPKIRCGKSLVKSMINFLLNKFWPLVVCCLLSTKGLSAWQLLKW
jgi:hypothetical protein